MLLPTSRNLPSKIAYQLPQIFYQRLVTEIIDLHQRFAYELNQSSTEDCLQLQQSCITKVCLPTSIKDCHKLQLSQLVEPCFIIIIIVIFFFFIINIHVLLSNISFWVSRFGKSSCCSPLPFQVHHHHHHHHISLPSFQAKSKL